MTNNHCPKTPARIHKTRKSEVEIAEFAEFIQNKITEFAESHSMDEMIILDSAIADSWINCPRCESAVCEIQGHAYGYVIKTVLGYLKAEFE